MPSPEQGDRSHSDPLFLANEPLVPSPLPPELADFLRDLPYACVPHASDQGTLLILKAPRAEIASAQGSFPIRMEHQLYEHSTAPVIRMVTRLYDQPTRPLMFECFINVGEADQREMYATLADQREMRFLFYDETLRHSLTKSVSGLDRVQMHEVLAKADAIYRGLTPATFDFDRAKADILHRTSL